MKSCKTTLYDGQAAKIYTYFSKKKSGIVSSLIKRKDEFHPFFSDVPAPELRSVNALRSAKTVSIVKYPSTKNPS